MRTLTKVSRGAMRKAGASGGIGGGASEWPARVEAALKAVNPSKPKPVNARMLSGDKALWWSIRTEGNATVKEWGWLDESDSPNTHERVHESELESTAFALKQIELKKLHGYNVSAVEDGARGGAGDDMDVDEEADDEEDGDNGSIFAYLEFVAGSSSKFWQISLSGKDTVVRFGRIGTNGQPSTKSHANDAAALKFAEKMVGEKLKKGYERASGGIPGDLEPAAPKKKAPKQKKAAAPAKKKAAAPAKKTAPKKKGGAVLGGATFCISGTLSVSRGEFRDMINDNGGKFISSVTGKVQYLVSTEDELEKSTIKINKARDLGVPIVAESFVTDSIENGELQDVDDHSLE